jgi:GNAT superfamily N-acetyltransferase
MVRVEQVSAEVTYPLRQRVLRPHQTVREVAFPGAEADPLAGTYAALADDGEVVGTASVYPEACPWAPDRPGAWRLRGMATSPEVRGQGLGAALVAAVLDHAAAAGGTLVWCHARTPAQAFYTRAGFAAYGEVFSEPDIGPHIRMWRSIP